MTTTPQNILSIDPACRAGFAFHDGTLRTYGVWQLAVSGTEHGGKRLNRLWDFIWGIEEAHGIDRIAFETSSNFTRGKSAIILHSEFAGIIKLAAAQLEVPFSAFTPAEVKEMAGLPANASKPQMIQAAKVKLGIETDDDNIADALFVLECARLGVSRKEKERVVKKQAKKQRDRRLFT